MPLQNHRCEIALQRGKAQPVVSIVSQKKLHEAVAKAANPVIENNWIGHRDYHGRTSDYRTTA